MSFNLNKLVQPECGGPNPLVAAAKQITMSAPSATVASTLRERQARINFAEEFNRQQSNSNPDAIIGTLNAPRVDPVAHHHHHHQQQQQTTTGIPIASTTQQFRLSTIMNPFMSVRVNEFNTSHSQTNTTFISAGEQLETKYRNDMMSQSSTLNHDDKLDDVEFWQSLSQMYIGPNTYSNMAKLRAERAARASGEMGTKFNGATEQTSLTREDDDEQQQEIDPSKWTEPIEFNDMEYVFDERNPLKDQYEDPFSEGLKRLEQGDIPSAALLFEAAVQKEPENALAWRYLGTTQAQNENDILAIRALKNCLHLDKNDQQARLAISVSLANETQHREACKYLLEWLINHERYRSINASLEEFHLFDQELMDDPFYLNSIEQKHYTYVKDKFVDAARLSPNNPDPEVQNSLGVLFNMRGEYDKAVDCFKAALSIRSDDSLLWNRLGATLANGNKSDEAVIAYRRALEISPGFLRSRYNLAISLIHLNLYDEAAKQLVQILNTQAAGKGSKNAQIRTRTITSTSIWNTLRTVATLLNQPELYPIIDGRDLAKCNEAIFRQQQQQQQQGESDGH